MPAAKMLFPPAKKVTVSAWFTLALVTTFINWSPGASSSLAAWRFRIRKASTVIQMPMPSCTQSATRCSARLAKRTSAIFFQTPTRAGKACPAKYFWRRPRNKWRLRGGKIVNVDATVIAQAPKIYPHIAEMKQRIAAALGVSEKQIGVKATTNELMGFIGREEGIAAMAVAGVDIG